MASHRRHPALCRGGRSDHHAALQGKAGEPTLTSSDALIVLASASSARVRLLREAAVPFAHDPADIDESAIKARMNGAAPADLAAALAEAKARAVAPRHPGAAVIGADQVLEADGGVLDKPGAADEARRHLERLRGRTHRLLSAVCVVSDDEVLWRHVEAASLTMRPFSDAFLEDYLNRAGDDTWRSVGAYRLEGLGAQLFERVDGDHFTIQGLPLLPLLGFLRQRGLLAG